MNAENITRSALEEAQEDYEKALKDLKEAQEDYEKAQQAKDWTRHNAPDELGYATSAVEMKAAQLEKAHETCNHMQQIIKDLETGDSV